MAPDTRSSYFNDINQANKLINKYVCVTTVDKLYHGFVYCIDPISETVVLSTSANSEVNISLVLGGSIKEVNICDPPADHMKHEIVTETKMDFEDTQMKKARVQNWLSRNLIPVKDVDEVLVVHNGVVCIQAPYRVEDCVTSNPIVLGRVQHLMKNMPDDDLTIRPVL